ncbi:putative NADPH-dependent methylglyoxal reductase Grp2p [[Candida] railenensis]|uniref:NADPH-dependent methylglyoxal reductase Grp2p n=1 Tax=[Candida] railenensis TaxID=45579 RepID=A0A9P0QS84_9ASCO|nr:putative NADPH-dependent methylglyoxal reductase Grp2p [[Candida] railenensis]
MGTAAFVSGATGFIAQHIIKQLLEKGYSVVGSVRNESKGETLKKNFATDKFSYEIVEDLETVGAFDTALKKHPEVTIFLHTASPVTFDVEDNEKDIILPAINGTVNVLKAIKATAPQVNKVVITSSVASQRTFSNPSALVSEDTWNDITYEQAKSDSVAAYYGSKTFAEKAAIEFVKNEEPHFTISTVHPVFVFGPQAFDSEAKGELNVTNTFISGLLKLKEGSDASVPTNSGTFIDVRDVAAAHLIEIEKPSNGLRVLVKNVDFNSQSLLNIINKNFPELGLIKGDPEAPVDKKRITDAKSRAYLGVNYIDIEKSVVDTVKQYVAANKLG